MTAPTLTLADFLLARIAEDEAAARGAEPGPWVVGTTSEPIGAPGRGEHWGETVFTRDGVYPQTVTVRGTHVASKSERPRMVADMARGYPRSLHEPTSDHIVRWDPARVLAECEAKRRIVADLLATRHEVVDGDCWYTCAVATEEQDGGECCNDSRRGTGCDCGRDSTVERRLRILALPYADHPDYREDWRP